MHASLLRCTLRTLLFIVIGAIIVPGCTKTEPTSQPTSPGIPSSQSAPPSETGDPRNPDLKGSKADASKVVNLLVNGSFEDGPDPGQWREIDVDSEIKGWLVTRGKIDCIGSLWGAAEGARSLDLNGLPGSGPGGIKQTFPTQPGKTYYVTFAMAGNPLAGPALKSLEVHAAGQKKEFSFDSTGRGANNLGWAVRHWEFAANAKVTSIEFISTTKDPGGAGPAIDRVSVTAVKPRDDTYPAPGEAAAAEARNQP